MQMNWWPFERQRYYEITLFNFIYEWQTKFPFKIIPRAHQTRHFYKMDGRNDFHHDFAQIENNGAWKR